MRGATCNLCRVLSRHTISIHAPRVGCDVLHAIELCLISDFNPRTPCGVRPAPFRKPRRRMLNFNPRTPCGVRPGTGDAVPDHQDFNPRTPCGVRLWTRLHSRSVTCISIHAPRAGCDSDPASRPSHRAHFNPRTPCGVRRCRSRPTRRSRRTFQSTHPVRGATRSRAEDQAGQDISIHAPRAGCDAARRTLSAVSAHFNPRTPCGVRRRPPAPSPAPPYFNPRTPCGVRREE